MTDASFNLMAGQVLTIMSELAEQENVKGMAFLANLEDARTNDWQCRMKYCGALTKVLANEERVNLAAIAFSKIAEMMDTKKDSGSNLRPPLLGEFQLSGGAILEDDFGYIAASFEGGSPEVNYSIAFRSIKFLQTII